MIGVRLYIAMREAGHLVRRAWGRAGRLLGLGGPAAATLRAPPLSAALPRAVPRRIWIYWAQGEAEAPIAVRRAITSWRRMNPGWQIDVLNAQSAPEAVMMPELPDNIGVAHYADVLRTRLLHEYGGVWVDATAICLRPLDEWLPQLAAGGFFAFAWLPGDRPFIRSAPPRRIANWFLASEQEGAIIDGWNRLTTQYWRGRRRAGSYFWHHYLFEWLILTDPAARAIWRRVPRISALPAHLAHHAMIRPEERGLALAGIGAATPIQKLSWRRPESAETAGALLRAGPTVDAPSTGPGERA